MEKVLLLGDEAIAQGFIDAGGSAINSYPGTPSTQIQPKSQSMSSTRSRPKNLA